MRIVCSAVLLAAAAWLAGSSGSIAAPVIGSAIKAAAEDIGIAESVHCRRYRHAHPRWHRWGHGCRGSVVIYDRSPRLRARVGVHVREGYRTRAHPGVTIRGGERSTIRSGTTIRGGTTVRGSSQGNTTVRGSATIRGGGAVGVSPRGSVSGGQTRQGTGATTGGGGQTRMNTAPASQGAPSGSQGGGQQGGGKQRGGERKQ